MLDTYLLAILKKLLEYRKDKNETIRQEIAELQWQAEELFIDLGSPLEYKGCLLFIRRQIAEEVG